MLDSMIRFFQDGGIFMYPIAVVLLFGMGVAVERWLFLSATRSSNKRAFDRLLPLLKKRDLNAIVDFSRSNNSAVSLIISAGVQRMQQSPRREDAEYAMEEGVMEIVPRLEKRSSYIATLANIATLLGLLGTIMGLIEAFTAVANADPSKKAALLSSSISVAMNTTAFGLIVAIPLLLVHTAVQNKTTEIIDSLEMAGIKTLNLLASSLGMNTQSRTGDPNVAAPIKPNVEKPKAP